MAKRNKAPCPFPAIVLDELAKFYGFEYEAELIPHLRHRLYVHVRILQPVTVQEAQSIGDAVRHQALVLMKFEGPRVFVTYRLLDEGSVELIPLTA